MHRIVVAPFFLFLLSPVTLAAQPQDLVDKFEKRVHQTEELDLPYRLFVPDSYDSTLSYPIILTMHGSGERGNDNEDQIAKNRLATAWAEPDIQSRWPGFVVSPQAPGGGSWHSIIDASGASAQPFGNRSDIRAETVATLSLLDSLQSEFNIDPDRVYVTGISLGSFGSFEILDRAPGRFAAAVPMSGGFYASTTQSLHNVPLWIFHGESDTVVDPEWSRQVVRALMQDGRPVLFTDCGLDPAVCSPISNPEFDEAIDARTDLIYTGLPGLGHEIWAESYADPRLAPWLFDQHRILQDGVSISRPAGYPSFTGDEEIIWDVNDETENGELSLSIDNGETWVRVDSAVSNSGSITLKTVDFADTPVAKARLVFFDKDGFLHRREESAPFIIDNDGDGQPFLRVYDWALWSNPIIVDPVINLGVLAADPEQSVLDVLVSYSADGGATFAQIAEAQLSSSVEYQDIQLDLEALPNAARAQGRVTATDGNTTVEILTRPFVKMTERRSTRAVEQTAGSGVADIQVRWVDEAALTGHRYGINFNDQVPTATAFAVTDLTTGQTVLADEPLSDGLTESRLFDGIRLVVFTPRKAEVDLDSTGWVSGDSDVVVTIGSPTVNTPNGRVELIATPADYDVEIFEEVADTSKSVFGFPENEMRFTVTNRSSGIVDVLFSDRDDDMLPTPGDIIYILEPDPTDGEQALSWLMSFSEGAETTLPKSGDRFQFRTRKPVTAADEFEFDAVIGVSTSDDEVPGVLELFAGYPNPFSSTSRVEYRLAEPGLVQRELFDSLGRRVWRTSASESTGRHSALVGRGPTGDRLAPGVYLFRLTVELADSRQEIKSILLTAIN